MSVIKKLSKLINYIFVANPSFDVKVFILLSKYIIKRENDLINLLKHPLNVLVLQKKCLLNLCLNKSLSLTKKTNFNLFWEVT